MKPTFVRAVALTSFFVLGGTGCPAEDEVPTNDSSETPVQPTEPTEPTVPTEPDPFAAMDPADVTTNANVSFFANVGNAARQYTANHRVTTAQGIADDETLRCPVCTTDRNVVTCTGDGCTDDDGDVVSGAFTITTVKAGGFEEVVYDFQDYVVATLGSCGGEAVWLASERTHGEHRRSTQISGDQRTSTFTNAIQYDTMRRNTDDCVEVTNTLLMHSEGDGTLLDGDPKSEERLTSWGGTATIGDTRRGVATVETTDLRWDTRIPETPCSTEALSGTVEIVADGHTSRVLYNGGVDDGCDLMARWDLDGQYVEDIDVSCSTAPSPGFLGLFGAGLLALWRGRRRDQRG